MLAFRSEAHVERWCQQRRISKGAVFTLDQAWRLADAWYANKLSPAWKRATAEEAERIFAAVGLTGDYWRLTK